MTVASVSQGGAETLFRVTPGNRTSQAGAEYLHRVQPGHGISQAGVEVLYKSVSCTRRWAQVWTITRVDGAVYRYASLDRDVDWAGHSFKSCNSLDPSASENVAEVDSAGSIDLSGALSDGGIEAQDLYGGLFDGATVEAWLVPWDQATGSGLPKRLLGGTFDQVTQTETGFKVEIIGDGAKLQQTPLVTMLKPGCRWVFGDEGCGKDLAPLRVSGFVEEATGLRQFTDTTRTETPGYFTRGKVTFTTGNNWGVTAEIKEHAAGGQFTLWPRLPYPIEALDAYVMEPGCTNLKANNGGCNGCTSWGQLLRYGGFDKVPGGDKRSKAATQRTSS